MQKQTVYARKAKRQRIFNRALLVGAMIVIVVITVVALNRPSPVILPSYLNRCIPLTGPWAYKSIFHLYIDINGARLTIPGNIGITGSSSAPCVRPLYTFTNNGAVHIEPDQNRTFTLSDFFKVWGNTYGTTWATFNQNQLFNYPADNTHPITMYVNNATNTSYENLVLPTNATTTQTSFYNVTITYG